jgi:hypothetical protein
VARQKAPDANGGGFRVLSGLLPSSYGHVSFSVSGASATVLLLSALAVVPGAEAVILASIGVVLPAQRIRDWPKRTSQGWRRPQPARSSVVGVLS